MKVFISQPMRDRTDAEIRFVRKLAIEDLSSKFDTEIEVIDTFFNDESFRDQAVVCLGKSIEKMQEAELAVFISDKEPWHAYRGCRIEFMVATEYDIPHMEINVAEIL